MGFKQATPIQQQAIPIIQNKKDLIACAQTGTGKTAAFLLPVIDFMLRHREERPQAIILVPTRELAIQIDQQAEGILYGLDLYSVAIYGGDDGSNWDQQKTALQDGADFIIATPGKLISHLAQGYANFSRLKYAILDEADRMLDIGFYDDIVRIFNHLPSERQTLMFSATMPPKIRQLASRILNEPEQISLSISKPAEGVTQLAYLVFDDQKIDLITNFIKEKPDYTSIIVFGPTRHGVKDINRALRKANLNSSWISSDLEQNERESLLSEFRNRKKRILVATDVLSRGIDIKDINLVINFSVPRDPEDYVHRVGRTARAATTGIAMTLINPDDMGAFHQIETLIERQIEKLSPPAELGPGPEWNPERKKRQGGGNFKKKRFGKN